MATPTATPVSRKWRSIRRRLRAPRRRRLLVDLFILRQLDFGGGLKTLLSAPEALADRRAWVMVDGVLDSFEHAWKALNASALSRVRRNENQLCVRRDGMRPLQVQA